MDWLNNNLIGIFALLVSIGAFCESRKANKAAENANTLSVEANQLSKEAVDLAKTKNDKDSMIEKNKLKEKIIQLIMDAWKEQGQGETTLKSEWEIYKTQLTIQDFNEIWEAVWLRYRKSKPTKTADKLIITSNTEN